MTEQSPIDIPADARVHPDDLRFRYRPSETRIGSDGYALRADPSGTSEVEVDGHVSRLLQFHLHSPAEHTFAGRASAAELHLVHADAAGALTVVGVLLEEGEAHAAFEALVSTERAVVDPAALLPADRAYVAYRGSLTTPPYSEGVTWRVLVQPITVSPDQLARLRALHDGNARPVQPLGERALETR